MAVPLTWFIEDEFGGAEVYYLFLMTQVRGGAGPCKGKG